MLRATVRAAAAAAFLLVAASLVPGDGAYSRVERLLSYLGPPAPASAQIRSVPSTAGSILFEFFQSRNLEVEGVSIDLDQSVRPSAQVEERRFASAALGEDRSYWVYLPPGYEESRERYPSLYLLHGMSQGHRWWSEVGRVDRIATSMIASGRIRPLIIVMPNGNRVEEDVTTTSIYDDRCETGLDIVARMLKALGDRFDRLMIYKVSCEGDFEEFIVEDLVGEIDSRYRTTGERYVGGFSIGGRGAMQLAFGNGDVFAGAFGMSGNYDYLRRALRDEEIAPVNGLKLFLATGDKDQRGVYGEINTYLFDKELERQGLEHLYCKYSGAHGDTVWVAAVPHALRYIVGTDTGISTESRTCESL